MRVESGASRFSRERERKLAASSTHSRRLSQRRFCKVQVILFKATTHGSRRVKYRCTCAKGNVQNLRNVGSGERCRRPLAPSTRQDAVPCNPEGRSGYH